LKFLLRKSYASERPTERQTDVVDFGRAGGGISVLTIKGAELALPSLRVAVAASLAYFTAAIFCINLADEANNIASLWLPNAIGLVVCSGTGLLSGRSCCSSREPPIFPM